MLEGFRVLLGRFLSLRWLSWRGRDLAVPAACALIIVQWSSWAGVAVGRLPLGLEALALVAATLAGREVAREAIERGLGAISVALLPGIVLGALAAVAELAAGERAAPVVGGACAAVIAAYLAGAVAGADGRRSRLQIALIAEVVSIWLLYDASQWADMRFYDLRVYLDSADRWAHGAAAYMPAPLHVFPFDPANDFALYPPPLLPVFALLARLPLGIVEAGWAALLLVCGFAAYRAIGLRTSWALLLLAFPPMAIGIASGNLTNLGFLLFALAGRAALPRGGRADALLPLGGLLKLQSAIPTLWLVRERRWRALAAGLGALAGIALVTLPVVGPDAWGDWWAGLINRAQSQAYVHEMFGSSYAKYVPAAAFAAIAIVAVLWALWPSGRRGLAALGLASVAASPVVWPHSFLFEIPAVLFLQKGAFLWLLLGAESFETHLWGAFYIGAAAVFVAGRVLPAADDLLHPLPAGAWPSELPDAASESESPGRRPGTADRRPDVKTDSLSA